MKNALISVYNKDGIVEFAKGLKDLDWNIYSSGGTATKLNDNTVSSSDVASLVGGKAILGHKVVTISRELAAGELADVSNEAEMREMEELGLPIIHLICVDCYPLKEEIAKPGATLESVLAKTDVGGMNMLHAAAKGRRIVLCDPTDRPKVLKWLQDGRPNEEEFINYLCAKAEAYCADYELASSMFLSQNKYFGVIGEKIDQPRYGENPWQKSLGLFKTFGYNPDLLAIDKFKTIVGTNGHINWTDLDRGLQTITHIAVACHKNIPSENKHYIAIGLKHGNCCGAAVADDAEVALQKMLDGNLLSIFGGTIMTNFPITESLAHIIRNYHSEKTKRLLDVIVAPAVDEAALEILGRRGDACKITVNPALENLGPDCLDKNVLMRPVRGGFLIQQNHDFVLDLDAEYITRHGNMNMLFPEDKLNIALAWAICSTSNSNTITLVKNGMLIGNGVGQQDRKECCELSIKRAIESAEDANHSTLDAVACSDSFFPFPDGPEQLIIAGVKTIFSLSGSVNDKLTIELCVKENITLVLMPNQLGRMFYGH